MCSNYFKVDTHLVSLIKKHLEYTKSIEGVNLKPFGQYERIAKIPSLNLMKYQCAD